jgi:hypothetical protein
MRLSIALAIVIGVAGFANPVYAQFVDDSVTSDVADNTGVGTYALYNLNSTNDPNCSYSAIQCTGNTAVGFGALPAITTGSYNTASGVNSLDQDTTGSNNTATGAYALYANISGNDNTATGYEAILNGTGTLSTATGYQALYENNGNMNTGTGYQALYGSNSGGLANLSGGNNTATGAQALYALSTGNSNTANGYQALFDTTTGGDNTASGGLALYSNTTGNYNTASGYAALYTNAGGNYNNASGYFTLHNNSSGSQNSASGVQALVNNKSGNYNTASGTDALFSNTTGSSNVAEGYKAGYNLTTGSNNIDIGNLGAAAESATIRIGTASTHKATYIAGIYGTSVTGSTVVVSSTGQLGVTVSSERFKTSIAPMGSSSGMLRRLRPVTFHLKTDPEGALQYGLIAEEVAKVYPELVIRNESGRIDGVRYDELAPMLLNEMQNRDAAQERRIAAQAAEIRALKEQQKQLVTRAEMQDLKEQLQAAFLKLDGEGELVAKH